MIPRQLRGLYFALLSIAMLLAACYPDDQLNPDWCYTFDFTSQDYGAIFTYGSWVAGEGFVTDEVGDLRFTYAHPVTVQPVRVEVTIARGIGVEGQIDITATGIIFGFNPSEVLPSPNIQVSLTADKEQETLTTDSYAAGLSGTTMTIGLGVTQQTRLMSVRVSGLGLNPFPSNECPKGTPTATVTASPTTSATPSKTYTPPPTATPVDPPTCLLPGQPTPTPIPTTPSPTPSGPICPRDEWLPATEYERVWTGSVYVPAGSSVDVKLDRPFYVRFSGVYRSPTEAKARYTADRWFDGGRLGLLASGEGIPVSNVANDLGGNVFNVVAVNPGLNGRDGATWPTVLITHVRFSSVVSNNTFSWVDVRNACQVAPPSPPSPTPWPNCTPTPTITPTTSPTPRPTNTPFPNTLTPVPSRTPSPTPFPIVPPTLIPTVTPGPTSTPRPPNTPRPATATLHPSVTPTGTVGPFEPPGSGDGWEGGEGGAGVGGLRGLGNSLTALGSNVWQRTTGWVNSVSSTIGSISEAWSTSVPTPLPLLPQCKTDPLANELCAIWYILSFTVLTGTVGGLIIPFAVIVVDLFYLFWFVRLARAILSQAKEIRR